MNKTFGNGRYQVIDKLGAGGMAVVYKAQDTVLNRVVTVKVLRDQFASDEDFTRRFRREAQAVASLSHPNIVSIYDVGMDQDQEYIVMEFVDGPNLKEYIKEHAPLPLEEALDISKQICDALDHAHKHQIIHRDIKPHNILLASDGRAKVTDFGIARAASSATVTHTGTIVGSVHYFSPEQARGEVTNEQSDIYSLGIILYEMVTGGLPFDGESPISIALKHMTEEPKPPSALNPAVPANLEQVIMRAISKYPDDRYADAKQFKQDLQRVGQGMSALPFKPGKRVEGDQMTQVMRPVKEAAPAGAAKPKRKLKAAVWITLIVLLLALLVGGAYASVRAWINPGETQMPDLSHLTVDQASQKLRLAGLHLSADNVTYETNNGEPAGHIYRQYPAPNTVIKVSRPDLAVWVSQGPATATMPDFSGNKIDKDTALNMLSQNGFTTTPTIQYIASNDVGEGIVVGQDPGPNTTWPKDGAVTLQVSKGPQDQTVQMPAVIGMTEDAALQALGKMTVTTNTQQSTDYPQGYVIDSTPKPGGDVLQGSEVTLVISSGPGPVAKMILAKDVAQLLSVTVPTDEKPHMVVIKLHDYRGWTDVDSFAYQPGTPYNKDIQYYPTATLQIFVDGVKMFERDYT